MPDHTQSRSRVPFPEFIPLSAPRLAAERQQWFEKELVCPVGLYGEMFSWGLNLADLPILCQETSCRGQPNVPLIPELYLFLSHCKVKGGLPLLSVLNAYSINSLSTLSPLHHTFGLPCLFRCKASPKQKTVFSIYCPRTELWGFFPWEVLLDCKT